MANENVRLGDSRLQFGLQDVAWGYLRNVRFGHQPPKSPATNGLGQTVAVEYYNIGEKTCSGSFYYLAGVNGPVEKIVDPAGFQIVNDEGTFIIENITDNRSSGEWRTIDFEGTCYPHLVNS